MLFGPKEITKLPSFQCAPSSIFADICKGRPRKGCEKNDNAKSKVNCGTPRTNPGMSSIRRIGGERDNGTEWVRFKNPKRPRVGSKRIAYLKRRESGSAGRRRLRAVCV